MEMFLKLQPLTFFGGGVAPLTGLITLASVCLSQTVFGCSTERMLLCLCDYTTANRVIAAITVTMQS